VDEYQDTNFAQHLIIKQLVSGHGRISVVGDDAQSIYSFRGANIDNILKFQSEFPGCRIFKLTQNYRSTQNIVNAANSLIEKNVKQIRKQVFSTNDAGEKVEIISAFSDTEESNIVANKIHDMHFSRQQYFRSFAILYRTNAQSRSFEEALRKRNIPYRIYGGLSFYQRKEIKDIVAYLRLIINNADETAFNRIINYPPRGIGNTTLAKITEVANRFSITYWEAAFNSQRYSIDIPTRTLNSLMKFKEMMDSFIARRDSMPAYELVDELVRVAGIVQDIYVDKTPENLSRQENLQELMTGIHEFCITRTEEGGSPTVAAFLSEVSLLTDQDDDKDENADKVSLMTIHAAKGLEFKNVFIVGMEEGLFPSFFAESSRDIEEERRLFYVAITRAEENCFISYAKSRFRNGTLDLTNPSRFLLDIDTKFLKTSGADIFNGRQSLSEQLMRKRELQQTSWSSPSINRPQQPERSPYPGKTASTVENTKTENDSQTSHRTTANPSVDNESLKVGDTVQHERFGIGKVKEISGTRDNIKALVDFQHVGEKNLLLKFARLKLIHS
jgi:DNA helicase-2/ATP-dependent DNA helicase PcrA